jgi:hypothetical protein
MGTFLNRMVGSRRRWQLALLLLGLLATATVQLAAATHWHRVAAPAAATDQGTPRAPASDGDRDGCLLCQVVAHAAATAPPPAPWVLVDAVEFGTISTPATLRGIAITRLSHAWQGRAPPRV